MATQPLAQRVQGHFLGGKQQGTPHLAPSLSMRRSIPLHPHCACLTSYGTDLSTGIIL